MTNASSDNIPDKDSFIRFVENLHKDHLANSNNRENKMLEDLLEALARYVEDIQGCYENTNIPFPDGSRPAR
jgi:hypothetical protein